MLKNIALRVPSQENTAFWQLKRRWISVGRVRQGQLLAEFFLPDKTVFYYRSPYDGDVQLLLQEPNEYFLPGEKIGELKYNQELTGGLHKRLQNIHTFIFDIDGVLTTGEVFAFEHEMTRVMSIKDGFALQLAVKLGYNVAIISGGTSEGVRKRLNGLGIKDIFLGCSDKLSVYQSYISGQKIGEDGVLYVGDDLPDIEVMKRVGVSACPMDAAWDIRQSVDWLLLAKAGTGCAREVIETALRIQNRWYENGNHYW